MESKDMMRIFFGFLLILSLCLPSCVTSNVRATLTWKCPDTETAPTFVPDQLLVVFEKGTESGRIRRINESLNVKVLDSMLGGEITLIEVPERMSIEEICQEYHAFVEVEAINLNYSGIRPLEKKP